MKNLPHLLCIDDDNKIRELLEIYLSSNNFRVSVAKDSFEAEKLTNFFLFFEPKHCFQQSRLM